MRGLYIVLGVVVAAGLALAAYFFVLPTIREGGEGLVVANVERNIAAMGGSVETIVYHSEARTLTLTNISVPNVPFGDNDNPLDLLEAESVRVLNPNGAPLEALLAGSGPRRVFDALTIEGIHAVEDGQVLDIDRLHISNMRLQDVDHDIQYSDDLTPAQYAAFVSLALEFDVLEMTGFHSPDDGATGMDISTLVLENFDQGQVGSLVVSGMELWDNGQMGTVGDTLEMSADALAIEDVDMTTALSRTLAGEDINFERQSNVPTFTRLRVDSVTASDEEGEVFQLAAFDWQNSDFHNAIAQRTIFTMTELRVALNENIANAAQVNTLRNLGYDELVVGFQSDSAYSFDTGVSELRDFAITLEDMGVFRMRMTLAETYLPDGFEDMTSAELVESGFLTELLAEADWVGGEISFVDQGLLNRLMDYQAAEEGRTAEEVQQEALTQLATTREEVANSPIAAEAVDALIVFIGAPGDITVSAYPANPVPVSELIIATQINPMLLIEILNLRISANEETAEEQAE